MRKIFIDGLIDSNAIWKIILINFLYMFFSVYFFLKMISISREKGLLINQGE